MITDINQLDPDKRYTYADYLTWRMEEMVELIRGRLFRVYPAPNIEHQRVSRRVSRLIDEYLDGKQCELFVAPFDVRLPLPHKFIRDNMVDTVVQPDICIVCDETKLDNRGCIGAPDWIIEILSPATAQKDFRENYDVYEHAGVREYWLIHPHEQTIIAYQLNDQGKFEAIARPYVATDIVASAIFPDCKIDLSRVFLP